MKRFLTLLAFGVLLVSTETMAQNWLNRMANDYRQRNQQRTTQRYNRQQTYQNRQRYGQQERANRQRVETQEREYLRQQSAGNSTGSNFAAPSNSQMKTQGNDKVITLVVNGTGKTKEEATRSALRSAIEQAFGTFVSANTEILNDNLIKDEIVTITSGNIRNYKELYCTSIGNNYDVSLQATVSIGSLISYAQNKGMKAELAGASFAMNMKMRKLNKENELKAMDNLKRQLCLLANSGLFDYQIEVGEPYMGKEKGHFGPDGKWTEDNTRRIAVDISVKQLVNSKTIQFRKSFLDVLFALGLTAKEREEYNSANVPYYIYNGYVGSNGGHIALRNKYDEGTIMDILSFARCFFTIKDNLGHYLKPYMRVYEGDYYKLEKGWGNGLYHHEGGMRSNESVIYYSGGKAIDISKNTSPDFVDARSYFLDDFLCSPNYKTGYRKENYNCLIEIGLSGTMLFSQKESYKAGYYDADAAREKYELFLKQGASVGKEFSKINYTLFYNETEIEQLNSIQVEPILFDLNIDSIVRF